MAGAVVLAMLAPLPVYAISTSIAKNNDQTFNEYWNGFETATRLDVQGCERDGSCRNTYSCDPYTVVEIEFYTDSEGKSQSRMVTRTKYHSCPYSSEETSYYVDTTLGSYTIGSNLMTGTPYRGGMGIPQGQVLSAPAFWTEAKTRVDAGNPGPVAKVATYKNYLLASESTIFKRYSNRIDEFRASNLLPDPTSGISGFYDASKAYFVGVDPKQVDIEEYSKDVAALSASFGTFLQGDLHVVFVDAESVGDPTDYGNSLMAYWQSHELGKNALAKNTMVVVIGVESYVAPALEEALDPAMPTIPVPIPLPLPENDDSATLITPIIPEGAGVVAWAKTYTGMPLGNESLITEVESNLKGEVLDGNLLGRPSYDIKNATMVESDGVLENMLFGKNKFERVSMSALDENDSGSGFGYLSDEWVPDAALMTLIYFISSALVLIVLGSAASLLYTGRYTLSDPLRDLIHFKEKSKE
jgi:hypothetical protein